MGVMALECILEAPARLACILFLNQGFLEFQGFFGKAFSVEHLGAHSNTVTLQREKAAWGVLVRCGWSRDTSPEDLDEELGTFHCQGWGFPSPMQAVGTRSPQPTGLFNLQSRFWGCCFHSPLKHSSAHHIFIFFLH